MQSMLLVTVALRVRTTRGLFDKPLVPFSSGLALSSPWEAVPACFSQPVGDLMPPLRDGPVVGPQRQSPVPVPERLRVLTLLPPQSLPLLCCLVLLAP